MSMRTPFCEKQKVWIHVYRTMWVRVQVLSELVWPTTTSSVSTGETNTKRSKTAQSVPSSMIKKELSMKDPFFWLHPFSAHARLADLRCYPLSAYPSSAETVFFFSQSTEALGLFVSQDVQIWSVPFCSAQVTCADLERCADSGRTRHGILGDRL